LHRLYVVPIRRLRDGEDPEEFENECEGWGECEAVEAEALVLGDGSDPASYGWTDEFGEGEDWVVHLDAPDALKKAGRWFAFIVDQAPIHLT
jgi:hypothetical protein